MDSSSWIHGSVGFMCGPAAFQYCREQEQQQHEVSSEIEQHLNKINMEMNMDDLDLLTNLYHAPRGGSFPSSSSISSSFSCSPEIGSTLGHVLMAPPTGLQFPEVSSVVEPGGMVLLPNDHQYVANFQDTRAATAPGTLSAFKRYNRHLGPQRRLLKPACGHRMFKSAMSVLTKMHTAMWYSYQQQTLAAEPPRNQLQHMISERRRREKLNDSFRDLKTVIPPVSKKLGKTSVLIIAREYVNSLKSKICELEEKNQALQSQLALCPSRAEQDGAGEKVKIQITRAVAAEGHQTGDVHTVKIEMPSRGNTTDVVLRILQRLKDQMGEDVSLVSMNTGEDSNRHRQARLTLHLKSLLGAKWEEETIREAVTKAMMRPAVLSEGGGRPCAPSFLSHRHTSSTP